MKQKWNEFLESKIAEAKAEEQRLISDERKDEANHQRIRGNIFEVFQTVYKALERAMAEENLRTAFEEKLENIPKSWKDSLEKAKEYHDAEKILIEEIKLEAVREIKEKFKEMWEE